MNSLRISPGKNGSTLHYHWLFLNVGKMEMNSKQCLTFGQYKWGNKVDLMAGKINELTLKLNAVSPMMNAVLRGE